jgi:hypothetical protein
MGHDEDPGRGRLLDNRLELDRPEVSVARIVARREDTAARRDLDDVGSHPNELTNLLPDLVRTVDEARRTAGMVDHERHRRARRVPVVAVAARLAEHDQRDLHPRPEEQALVDRLLDAEVSAAGVADARDPGPERVGQVAPGLVELARERPLDGAPEVDVADRDVDIAVEESGQDRPALEIEILVPVEARADRDDPPLLDGDVGGGRGGTGAVEQAPAPEHGPRHRSPPISSVALNTSEPAIPASRYDHRPSPSPHAASSSTAPGSAAAAYSRR